MELTKMKEAISLVKQITDLNIKVDISNSLSEIEEFLKKEKVTIDASKVINGEYLEYNDEIKSKLLLYFYIGEFKLSKTKLQKCLGLKMNIVDSILEGFTFLQKIFCPCCKKEVIVMMKDAKEPYIKDDAICSACKHKIDAYRIHSDCECEQCKGLIDSIHSFFKDLKMNIEKEIEVVSQIAIQICQTHNDLNTEKRLEWYAKKYSSDLNKTEREIISFEPTSFNELQNFIGNKRYKEIEQSLLNKKIIYEKYVPYDISYILDKVFSSLYIRLLVHIRGISNQTINFSKIDFSNISIDYVHLDKRYKDDILHINWNKDAFSIRKENEEENIFIEICDFLFIMNNFERIVSDKDCYFIENTLNPYYFNKEDISDYAVTDNTKIIPIFKSPVEISKYHFLTQKYPTHIVIPNVSLPYFANMEHIKSSFNKEEIKYLWKCKIDLVIFTEDGLPIKAIELQRGKHHDDEEQIKKDKLKRKAIRLLGLLYEEEF